MEAQVPDVNEDAAQGIGSLPVDLLAAILAHSLGQPCVSRAFHSAFLSAFASSHLCVEWALERMGGVHAAAYLWLVDLH